MTSRQLSLLLVIAALVGTFAACGSSASKPLSIAFSSTPPAAMTADTPLSITATVTNDSKSGGVDWTATCSTSSCGSFSAAHTASGTSTTYTAPAVPPAGGVTVKAASTTDSTKTVSATIAINASGPLADGTYVFQLSGEDNNGPSPFTATGAFTVFGGAITAAEEDFNDFAVIGNGSIDPTISSITTTSDGNLAIALDASASLGLSPQILNVTLTSPTSGIVSEFDTFATGSGTLRLQTSQAALAKGYAFFSSGYDFNIGAPMAIGGVINVDGTGTISGSGSTIDVNDTLDGGLGIDLPVDGTSTVLAPDSLGRVAFIVDSGGTAQFLVLAGYIVDSNSIALVESGDSLSGITAGTAYAQGNKTGLFSDADLSGSTYVVGTQGGDTTLNFLDFAGALTFNSGIVTGNATFNDGATQISGSALGAYTVDATGTGRVTVTGLTVGGLGPATIEFYLDGNGNAPVASVDLNDVFSGPGFKQTSGASVSGNYALGGIGIGNSGLWSAVGPLGVSSGTIGSTSFVDFNYFGVDQTANVPLTGTISSGTGTIFGLNADGGSGVSDTFDFYVVDSNRAFGIESDALQLGLLYTELQH